MALRFNSDSITGWRASHGQITTDYIIKGIESHYGRESTGSRIKEGQLIQEERIWCSISQSLHIAAR